MNYNIDKPFLNDHKRNISIMCHSGVGKIRCICNLKNGNRCKNKPVLMLQSLRAAHLTPQAQKLLCQISIWLFLRCKNLLRFFPVAAPCSV